MNCALIGTSKIAEVHLLELIKIGAKKIVIISRNINRGKNLCEKYKYKFPNVNFCYSNKKILKEKRFDLIDICTSNGTHDLYLKYINKSNNIILVEKPIISLKKFKSNYKKILDQIYKKNNRLLVCYPMTYLAKKFKKYFNSKKKYNTFDFIFHTGGRYNKENINIDLMPHALSFISSFFSNKMLYKNLKINNITVKKNKWVSKFSLDNINFLFDLSEKNKSKTSLMIKYNKKKIIRNTKIINNLFLNILIYKNKVNKIENPMTEFFEDLKKNKNSKIFYEKNKKLTYQIMNTNYKFLI
tara:strand:+ start:2885 stop:3781 length:897 start_codon:yes stop_codon:yes gene_type:complete